LQLSLYTFLSFPAPFFCEEKKRQEPKRVSAGFDQILANECALVMVKLCDFPCNADKFLVI